MKIIIIIFLFILMVNDLFAKKKDILVIESYHAKYPWDVSYKEGLKEILSSKYNLIFFEMDTKRIPKNKYKMMADLAWAKYLSIKPELVILGDDNALKYLGARFAKTETKVVYLGINNNPREYSIAGYKNIAGVIERPLLKRSIKNHSNILKVKKVLVLFDSGTTAQSTLNEIFFGKTTLLLQDIIVDIKLLDKFEVWKDTVRNSKKEGYDIIIVGLYHTIKDKFGNNVDANKILKWTSVNTPLPPFAFWDFAVGEEKTIGGYVLFGKAQGLEAAKIALNMLRDKNFSLRLPIKAEEGQFLFSKSQLKKWNLKLGYEISGKIKYVK